MELEAVKTKSNELIIKGNLMEKSQNDVEYSEFT